MFSAGKYNNFKYLFYSLYVCFILVTLSSAHAATTLQIITPDGVIATSVQTYTDTASSPTSAAVQENNAILFSSNNSTPENWSAEFTAPLNKQLEATNYENAVRPDVAPQNIKSPTKPGINITIGSTFRQCKIKVFGRFDVLEVSYDSNGKLTRLAVDFIQYCDNDIALKLNPLRGSIRHNSNLELETLVPIAIAGADQRVVENNIVDLTKTPVTKTGNSIKLTGSNSSAGKSATISSYQWTQLSGAAVNFIDSSDTVSTISNPSFIIPDDIKLGGDKLVFELTVTNSNGTSDTDTVSIFVASQSDPQTSFFFTSDQLDYVGAGQSLYTDIDDALITVDKTDIDHAHISIDNGVFWYARFAAIIGNGLIVSNYNNVVKHPDITGVSPSLSIHNLNTRCSNISGNFEVIQNIRDTNDEIKNLGINFVQICNQASNATPTPKLSGYIKYNFIDPSVPTANAGSTQTVTEATQVTLDASKSDDPDGTINKYQWKQLSGTPITLSDDLSINPTFTAPDYALSSNEDLVFQITVTDDLKFKAKSSVNITVIEKIVKPPVETQPPVIDNSAIGGGGGGCSINNNATVDYTFYLMLLIASLIQIFRIRKTFNI